MCVVTAELSASASRLKHAAHTRNQVPVPACTSDIGYMTSPWQHYMYEHAHYMRKLNSITDTPIVNVLSISIILIIC